MRPMRFFRLLLPVLSPLVAAGCGTPLKTKEEVAQSVAHTAVPSRSAEGHLLSLYGAALEAPSFEVPGPSGGKAQVSINPVGAAVGLASEGLLFDVQYDGFSIDGSHVFDGLLSSRANFDYVPAAAGEDPRADLSLSLVGRVELGGDFSDDLELSVKLTTELSDLSLRDEGIRLRLDGRVETGSQSFEFAGEDFDAAWSAK